MSKIDRPNPSGASNPAHAETEPSGPPRAQPAANTPAPHKPRELSGGAGTFAVLWFLLPLAALIGLAFMGAP